ncbi:MAG: chemotaxis protein CheC [Huintestinicola sp.]
MSITAFSQFTELHVSFMQEIGNMGTGNAATALADMIGTATDISVPLVRQIKLSEAAAIADRLSSATVSRLIKIGGDMGGCLLIIMPFEYVESLAGSFFPGTSVKSKGDMNEMVTSVVNETVNIVSASYVNTFAEMTGLFFDISVPFDLPAPSAEIIAAHPAGTDTVYFVNTSIVISSAGKQCNLMYFPTLDSMVKFMGTIGIEC